MIKRNEIDFCARNIDTNFAECEKLKLWEGTKEMDDLTITSVHIIY